VGRGTTEKSLSGRGDVGCHVGVEWTAGREERAGYISGGTAARTVLEVSLSLSLLSSRAKVSVRRFLCAGENVGGRAGGRAIPLWD
jgi:hypothetical protein